MRPPVVAREAPSAWQARWRFRLAALLGLALVVAVAVLGYRAWSGAAAQDPGFGAAPPSSLDIHGAGAGLQAVAGPVAVS